MTACNPSQHKTYAGDLERKNSFTWYASSEVTFWILDVNHFLVPETSYGLGPMVLVLWSWSCGRPGGPIIIISSARMILIDGLNKHNQNRFHFINCAENCRKQNKGSWSEWIVSVQLRSSCYPQWIFGLSLWVQLELYRRFNTESFSRRRNKNSLRDLQT